MLSTLLNFTVDINNFNTLMLQFVRKFLYTNIKYFKIKINILNLHFKKLMFPDNLL